MNALSFGRALLVGAIALLAAPRECMAQVPHRLNSIPTSVSVPDDAAQRLRGGQEIALRNYYDAPTKVVVGVVTSPITGPSYKWEADLHEFTDTAISLLERRMQKDGITIDDGAKKSVTLRVREMSGTNPYGYARASVILEARLGNGMTTAYQRDYETFGVGPSPAFDRAVREAVIALLNDGDFRAYVSR